MREAVLLETTDRISQLGILVDKLQLKVANGEDVRDAVLVETFDRLDQLGGLTDQTQLGNLQRKAEEALTQLQQDVNQLKIFQNKIESNPLMQEIIRQPS